MGVNTTNASPHIKAGSSPMWGLAAAREYSLSMVRVAAQVVAAHPDVDAAGHGKIMGQVRPVAQRQNALRHTPYTLYPFQSLHTLCRL